MNIGLTRLDHTIHAVHDLAAASATYERLGFKVVFGGEHPQWGTHNAIIRFGLDYTELLAIKDRQKAEESGFRTALLAYLDRGEGWIGYAVATADARAAVAELERRGVEAEGPIPGQRRRPDGKLLEWRTIGLGMPLMRRLVPFLIQHLPDDQERMRTFEAEGVLGGHPIGARRLRSVTLAVEDLAAAERVYRDELGLQATGYEENAWLGASTAWLRLGNDIVILAQPTAADSPVAAELERRGEGLFALEVEVDDLERAVDFARRAGFESERIGTGRTVMLDPADVHGARIALSQRS